MVKEDGVGRAGNGGLQIAVAENDVGRFAAQLQRHFLEVPGGGLKNQFADFRGTGESHFVDVRMRRQGGARGFAIARDDVHHSVGNAGLQNQLAQPQASERGLFGRLDHHGASRSQRRSQLPGRHQQREVPRDDLTDHADRLAQSVGQKLVPAEIGMVLPSILVAQPAM